MRRILFVSRYYASDFGVKVGGVFQRMRLLLDGAAAAADALDILFFVDQRMIDDVGPVVARDSLRRHWGIDANVALAPRASMRHGPLLQTLKALVDYRAQDDYFRLNGPAQRAAVRASVRDETDLIVAHRLYAGSVVVAAISGRAPIVMDLDDIEHRNRMRQLALATAPRPSRTARLELPALKRGELATLRACATSFVCSSIDRDYLRDAGVANTTVIPNAVRFEDAPQFDGGTDAATLVFVGTYGYRPNADAAEFLIDAVWPIVLARRPDARLLIVGESVEKLPSAKRVVEGVEFVGFVGDLARMYRRANVVCCPILAGGGTRIKIIEAAAAGKAIVSTSVGAEGLEFADAREIVLRDTPAAFAEACVDLVEDRPRRIALGRAACERGRALYERGAVRDRVAQSFREHARRVSR